MKGRDSHVQQKARQYLAAHGRLRYSILPDDKILSGLKPKQIDYHGEVVFDGRRHLVRAVTIPSDDVIVGLSLLRDKRLLVDFRTGVVTIE
jgi:hypothetical protein